MAISSTTHIAAVGLGCAAYWYFSTRMVPTSVERTTTELLAMLEEEDCSEEVVDMGPRHRHRRFRRDTLIVKVTRGLKEKFQIIENPQQVDRVAVRRYAVELMLEMKDIRPVDISRVAPIAAELYWAKTRTEILASQVRSTAAVRNSQHAYVRRYFPAPWRLALGWLRPAQAD